MQLLVTLALLFQAINPFVTVTPTENLPLHNGVSAFGWTSCQNGVSTIQIWRYSGVSTLLHEAAHAYDCLDNNIMDGSPLPWLCQPSLECAETYALYVQYNFQYK